jgi:hypothetical protein
MSEKIPIRLLATVLLRLTQNDLVGYRPAADVT